VGVGVGLGFQYEGFYFVQKNNSSLFNIDGVRTRSLLIKTEGLVTPLAAIYLLLY